MKRLRTRREYHDSQLTSAEWLRERDLRLTFRLDGNWNGNTSIESSVMFSGVRNREVVDETLRALGEAAVGRDWLADVVAIVRNEDRSYLVDTSQGSLVIDADGFSEI
jgi:hypothetical protein